LFLCLNVCIIISWFHWCFMNILHLIDKFMLIVQEHKMICIFLPLIPHLRKELSNTNVVYFGIVYLNICKFVLLLKCLKRLAKNILFLCAVMIDCRSDRMICSLPCL